MDESLFDEFASLEEELGEYPPIPVCRTHGRVLTCSQGKVDGNECVWSTHEKDIKIVMEYQSRRKGNSD